MAITKTNNAEGGTNGSVVTIANSGGTSGTAWSVTPAGSPTYSSTAARHGSLGYSLTGPTDSLTWTGFNDTTGVYRVYMGTLPTLPGSDSTFGPLIQTSTGSTILNLTLQAAGTYRLYMVTGNLTSTVTAQTGDRIEVAFTIGASTSTGHVDVYIYRGDSSTVAEHLSTTTGNLGTTNWDKFRLNPGWAGIAQYDDIAAASGTTTLFGPAVTVPSNAVTPKSTCTGAYNPTGGLASGAFTLPSGGAVGDPLGLLVVQHSSTYQAMTTGGWTIIPGLSGTSGTSSWAFYKRAGGWQTSDGTSVTLTFAANVVITYDAILLDQTVYSDFGSAGLVNSKSTSTTAVVCPAAGSAGTPTLLVAYDKGNGKTAGYTPTVSPADATQLSYVHVTATGTADTYLGTYDTSNAVADHTVTFQIASSNGAGFQLPVTPATVAPVTAPAGIVGAVSVDTAQGYTPISGNLLTCLTDGSYSTYISATAAGSSLAFTLANLTPPTTNQPLLVCLAMDAQATATASLTAQLWDSGGTLQSTLTGVPIAIGSGASIDSVVGLSFPWSDVQNVADWTKMQVRIPTITTDVGGTVRIAEARAFAIESIKSWSGAVWTPVADPDTTVAVSLSAAPFATVTLDSSLAWRDLDPATAVYAWTQTGGTTVTLSSSTVAAPTFTAPAATTVATLTFQCVAHDATHGNRTGIFTVTVARHNLFLLTGTGPQPLRLTQL